MFRKLLGELPIHDKDKSGWPWTIETDPLIYDPGVQWPKITIVTPSYNQGQFIEETIRSILLQNYPNLEYIIIDGGSTDQTLDIIKKYEPWLTRWVSEKDRGQSHAINKGLQQATGEIVNWINSDDFLAKDALAGIVKEFLKPGFDAGIIEGKIRHFGINEDNFIFESNQHKKLEEILPGMPCPQPSAFFLKKYYTSCGGLREEYAYAMDYDLYTKILLSSKISYIDNVVSHFRLHDTSKSSTKRILFLKEAKEIFLNFCHRYHWDEVLGHVKKCGEYSDPRDPGILKEEALDKPVKIDQEFLAMNFLSTRAEQYFNNNELRKSKKIMRYLTHTFPKNDLVKINPFNRIKYKSKLPVFLIRGMKQFKSWNREVRYVLQGK